MARPGIQQVHRHDRGDQHRDPDRVVDAVGIEHAQRADLKRGNAGDAVIAPEEFELAEQIEQAKPPGERAERQIMTRQAHGHEAEHHGGKAGDDQRQRQGQPGRDAVIRRQHRGGVGAEADKGGLSERGEAADAGQQHEPHRDEGRQADIVQQHDPEWRHAGHVGNHCHDQREQKNGPALCHGLVLLVLDRRGSGERT
jgi:hypothetical protein